MQLRSSDNKIVIDLVDSTADAILPQADFSLIEVPAAPDEAKAFYKNLYRTQKSNHCSLNTVRLPRKFRLKVFANLLYAEDAGFKYHDHITIFCQEEYKSIPSNLTQLGETTVLLTKSDDVRKESTNWFRPDVGDASNVWDVTPQPHELQLQRTVSRHFCYELGLLLANCASPLVCRKFLLISHPEVAHVEFAYAYSLSMHCVTTDELAARRVIRYYNKLNKPKAKEE
jgi:hypothetical protein